MKPETEVLPEISFARTRMVQGGGMKMRIIKQKKQRCKRKEETETQNGTGKGTQ